LSLNYGEVNLVYTEFVSLSNIKVTERPLLPFNISSDNDNKIDDLEYTFEPDLESVYSVVIGLLISNIIEGSLSESKAAEHSSRMLAMKTATDNASDMLSDLKLWYNKARQAHITQEIAEISAGSLSR
jgi:F-type H+-transporting ATPase subunit gamma